MKISAANEPMPLSFLVKEGMGICVANLAHQKELAAVSDQMNIRAAILEGHHPDPMRLRSLELIVADELIARDLLSFFSEHEEQGQGLSPAVVAVMGPDAAPLIGYKEADCNFDGILKLPLSADEVSKQLRVIMFAHRAFANRYQAAWAELRLTRRIFRSVTTGVSVASATLPDLPLVYVNPAFEEMTGYSRAEVQGKNCRFLEGPERNQAGLSVIREALANQRRGVAVLKNFRKDGTPFWNELSLSPISNDEGELTHYVGIQTDVTSRVEFEAGLRESEKLAAVGRLASSIAHEINNPLASVMNLIYLAERTDCSRETKDQLALADRELRRVKLITEQALRFSRQSTNPQATTATELLDPILDLYQSHARNAGVTMQRRDRTAMPLVCMESEIRQVLNNLVSNAVYAMREIGGTLSVRSREASCWRTGGKGLLFTLADTGVGMSAETRSNIYKAFFTTKGIDGTGLGLWISCEIVERHGGRLRVKSSQNPHQRGTTFQLFLPYKDVTPGAGTES